jgi:hypothetical protein
MLPLTEPALKWIEQLDQTDWFCRVGQEPISSERILRAHSWDDAFREWASPDWFRKRKTEIHAAEERLRDINADAADYWPTAWSSAQWLVEPVVLQHLARWRDQVRFDISFETGLCRLCLLAATELHFDEYLHGGWGQVVCHWILDGHLPCGWRGVSGDEWALVVS